MNLNKIWFGNHFHVLLEIAEKQILTAAYSNKPNYIIAEVQIFLCLCKHVNNNGLVCSDKSNSICFENL